jgi:hypothetical protein
LALTDLDYCTQAPLCGTYRVIVKGRGCHAPVVTSGARSVWVISKVSDLMLRYPPGRRERKG